MTDDFYGPSSKTADDVKVGTRWRGIVDTFEVVEVDGDYARLIYIGGRSLADREEERGYNEGPWWETRADIASAFEYAGRI